MSQVITFTLFKIKPKSRWWAFTQMGFVPRKLSNEKNIGFYKLMGCGKGLVYSVFPDWSRYALLTCWPDLKSAKEFISESEILTTYRKHSLETGTFFMKNIRSNGSWDNQNPFQPDTSYNNPELPLAIITRAALKPTQLPAFSRQAKKADQQLQQVSGLIASVGSGELPWIRQATFSVWENEDAMRTYAYKSADHQKAIKQTKERNWYSEELFARFRVIHATGKWNGKDLNLYQSLNS